MSPLHLGDPALTRKMTRIYGWILPGCFAVVTLLLLSAQAWLAAIPPLRVVLMTLPPLARYQRLRSGGLRFLIGAGLTLVTFWLSGLYI